MARAAADIQADLDAMYAARRQALIPGYSLDSGQGRQTRQPLDLSAIQAAIGQLEFELTDATDTTGGVQTGEMRRY